MELELEQVEAGCSALRPSWDCTYSRGAATCAAPSAGPALCSSDLSPRHSAASIAQTVPWSWDEDTLLTRNNHLADFCNLKALFHHLNSLLLGPQHKCIHWPQDRAIAADRVDS